MPRSTRERAVALGDLARIKVDRGEVDAALGLQDECLDVTRRLGDQEGIAAAQNDRFDLLLQKQRWQDAREAISESFTILTPIGRLDGLGVVGMKFGRFLAQAGQTDAARQVLGIARQAWEKLNQHPYVEQIDQLLQSIESRAGDAPADKD